MTPEHALIAAWALWIASWLAAALWAAPAANRPARGAEWLYRVVTLAGAFLLFSAFRHPEYGRAVLWVPGEAAGWPLVVIAVLGFAFTWWARLHLGRLWSSSVTSKQDHHLVDTGPYAIVRHPIYAGIITAVLATALLKGVLIGILGALLMTFGFWIKARLEERFLREQLGPDIYDAYRRRAPMLIPFGPKSA